MANFNVPTRDQVSANNQAIFDNLEKGLGFVPNLYATYAYSDTALGDYLSLANRKTTLSSKEKEVVNLVVSQVNGCDYCLSAHTAIGKMNGFTDEQIIEIRTGEVYFDHKLAALAAFVKDTSEQRGKPNADSIERLFEAGYTKANLVDIIVLIGDKTISNYLHGATQVPIDFPKAASINEVAA